MKKWIVLALFLLGCGSDPVKAVANVPTPIVEVKWEDPVGRIFDKAKTENKNLLFYFYVNNCKHCQKIDESFKDSCVAKVIENNFVPVKINADEEIEIVEALLKEKKYPSLIFGFADGEMVPVALQGYHPPQTLCPVLVKVNDILRRNAK